jgi:hypothetical protein
MIMITLPASNELRVYRNPDPGLHSYKELNIGLNFIVHCTVGAQQNTINQFHRFYSSDTSICVVFCLWIVDFES